MTHDTGLVEAVARVLDPEAWGFWDKMQLERDRCDETLVQARAALDAIDASGTHVVLPVEPTGRMTLAGNHAWCGFNESVIMGPLSPGRAEFTAIYKAMLTAAKEQP